MFVLHIYRAADPADSGTPLDIQDLIAPTPAWLARRTIDVVATVHAHLYDDDGTDRYFTTKTTVEEWSSFTWTDTTPPPPDEEVTSTFDTVTTTDTWEDSGSAARGFDIEVTGPDTLKDDDVSLDSSTTGTGWDNPPGSAIGSLKSGYPQETVTDLGGSFEVETVWAYENGSGDTTTRTVTVTYSDEVLVADLVSAVEDELAADWETAWSAAPALQWFNGGTIDTDSWSAPSDLDAGTEVTARVTDLIGLGVRTDPQPWLCRETTTDNSGPTDTDTDLTRILEPSEVIDTGGLAGSGTIFDNFVNNLADYDDQDPPQLLRSPLDDIVLDIHTELSLADGDNYTRRIKFIRTWRLLANYAADVSNNFNLVGP